MIFPIITKRLKITEFNINMAESVHMSSLDEDNMRFLPDEVFNTVEEAKETIELLISFYRLNNKPLVFPVLLHTGQHIGHVQAVPISNGWEVGYHIFKPYTKNGYATEAVTAFLPYITKKLGIDKIYGICSADNISSRKVLEKCGFILEYEGLGFLHEHEQQIGRYIREFH